ncbi:MAG: hypothetical protein NC402_01605 [Prevotella sp.]|nr:hypothetical protein [Prevotella sp.]MCM1074561.1 hypothetical protein [Ruminococcus sp.]
MKEKKLYWWKAIASFLFVLFMMPLGHALMIIMEHTMDETTLHYAAFAMGAAGMVFVIIGVFAKGDTKQTLWGLTGGLLFWTGWVEFLFMYFANRFGTQPQLDPVTGEVVSRPEYLIMPASFGFWVMVLMLYTFSTRNGCNFINWIQRRVLGRKKDLVAARPMTRHSSIITFMELMMILWGSYLLLMFCYDDRFLGDHHPVTLFIGLGCLIGSVFIFIKQLHIPAWGANIRMAIATVIVFWTPVEIMGRMNLFKEIWIAPMQHKPEMITILGAFLILAIYLIWKARVNKSVSNKKA